VKIFGKTLSEYIAFEKWFLILVLVVGLLKLELSLLGVSYSVDKYLSLTVLMLIGMLYYSIKVHTSGFGSYKQLLPVLALPAILAQAIVVGGIILAIKTGKDNIYSIPEVSGKVDGKTWSHALGHLMAMVIFPLVLWVLGSLLMFAAKKASGGRPQKESARA
jgi:hypothetical protein